MTRLLRFLLGVGSLWLAATCLSVSWAQDRRLDPARIELPAAGSGPLLVLFTGADGVYSHLDQAKAFGREGWIVAVVDGSEALIDPASEVRTLVQRALARPEARSRKAAVVGYSRGGWLVLAYANRMPDLVAAAVAFYPSTSAIFDPKAFLASPVVGAPTLVLAGARDTYMDCCLIGRARALAAAAALPESRAPLELVEYADADHGFMLPAYPPVYRPTDAADAFRRANEHLRKFRYD